MLSIGCNADHEAQMLLARRKLSEAFSGIRLTDAVTTAACGKHAAAEPYSNMLAECRTGLSVEELTVMLKQLEREMGDSAAQRAEGRVMMDIDLLEYNGERHHKDDWHRPYIKPLLAMLGRMLMVVLLCFGCDTAVFSQRQTPSHRQDTELLGKAVEYYQGGKYHECVLAFEKLRRSYQLTPRFLAYLGFSYYKEQRYEEATEILQTVMPQLSAYSPRERAVYAYSCAESLFTLRRYRESLKYYDMALPLTEGNDRADVLFHTAFAYHLDSIPPQYGDTLATVGDTIGSVTVIQLLSEALSLYKANTATATPLQAARLRQCERMLKALRPKRTDTP